MPSRGLLAEVRAVIARDRLLDERDTVLVAVSGGADSVALLEALVRLGQGRWRIGVGHVNHRLRGSRSDGDARFVARLARELGLELHELDGACGDGPNLEERARERRYALLLETARAGGYRRVATGHTLDDRAETLIHHLVRGSGPRGLAALRVERADGVIRPLVETTRTAVLSFLRELRRSWRRDASNADPRFTRNRIRRRVLPVLEREVGPHVRQALARAARLLDEEDAWIDGIAARHLRMAAHGAALDAAALARRPRALGRRIVREWLRRRRGNLLGLSFEHVESILDLRPGGRATIARGVVRRTGDELCWGEPAVGPRPRGGDLTPGHSVPFGDCLLTAEVREGRGPRPTRWTAVFDRSRLDLSGLRVRSAQPGDRMRPLGLGGSKKLQDVFVDAKLARERRAFHPVVECGRTILWIPGLARGDTAPVDPSTRAALVLRCRAPSAQKARKK